MKGPTQFCSLDFDAVCLTTGSGLLAAGGEHSELDIRPLLPAPQTSNIGSNREGTSSEAGVVQQSSSHSRNQRYIPRWHLRTPTGGSINNNICIQPEPNLNPSTIRGVLFDEQKCSIQTSSPSEEKLGHREKRRKEDMARKSNNFAWKRDEPWGRPGEDEMPDQEGEGSEEAIGVLRSGKEGNTYANKATRSNTIRLMISNNDRSVKAFRLRPPTRNRTPQNECVQSEGIESGLPGLSRTQIIAFPTCINHSSFSPNGRHVVSVGDTPEVFLFSVDPISSELSKIATYTASSDASFSTTWSPDSMQFAVASQDGIVSVWDVRSSKKIASLRTTQFSDLYGAGAARVVKWSPRGDFLAFSEQQNYVHIVDTISFEIVQRIRLPTLTMVNGPWGETNLGRVNHTSQGSDNVDSVLLAAGAGGVTRLESDPTLTNSETAIPTNEEWLESTSPARFASTNRTSASNEGSNLSRQWPNGRRYRDIGNHHPTRSGLDRTLLGDWINARRSPLSGPSSSSSTLRLGTAGTNTAQQRRTIRQSQRDTEEMDMRRTYAEAVSSSPSTNEIIWQNEVHNPVMSAVRSVDSILTGIGDVTDRGSGVWSIGPNVGGRLRRRDDSNVEISGLTWDPDGDHLYVSTSELIARYTVIDLRRSFGQASVR
ncbi:hypothetical protein L7F22_039097 [Adiantum nelumboides]|nr:hypothetical protein [Adiantum nelumboides]